MEVPGSLLQAIQTLSSSLAVLVIDESGYVEDQMDPFASQRVSFLPGDDVTWAQQRVIMLAKANNCPIIFIQFDISRESGVYLYRQGKDFNYDEYHQYLETRGPKAIHTPLRALLPMDTIVINKRASNAFHDTPLNDWIKWQASMRDVHNLVVIGWHSNKCIPATLDPLENELNGLGALSYGFNVLTCQKVLNGPPAWWAKYSEQLAFFSHL